MIHLIWIWTFPGLRIKGLIALFVVQAIRMCHHLAQSLDTPSQAGISRSNIDLVFEALVLKYSFIQFFLNHAVSFRGIDKKFLKAKRARARELWDLHWTWLWYRFSTRSHMCAYLDYVDIFWLRKTWGKLTATLLECNSTSCSKNGREEAERTRDFINWSRSRGWSSPFSAAKISRCSWQYIPPTQRGTVDQDWIQLDHKKRNHVLSQVSMLHHVLTFVGSKAVIEVNCNHTICVCAYYKPYFKSCLWVAAKLHTVGSHTESFPYFAACMFEGMLWLVGSALWVVCIIQYEI